MRCTGPCGRRWRVEFYCSSCWPVIYDRVVAGGWRSSAAVKSSRRWSNPQRRANEVVGAVVTFLDITESRRVEEQLRLAQASVEEASDAVSWLDSQGHILYVNEAACRSLGRSREELVVLSITDIVPDLTAEAWATTWAKVKTLGSITFETRHKTKLGQILPVEVSASYVEFGGKEFSFRFARDIMPPYERLLGDAIRGDNELFSRQDLLSRRSGALWNRYWEM